jgi:tetratricopeptide (TPR) repeat protein
VASASTSWFARNHERLARIGIVVAALALFAPFARAPISQELVVRSQGALFVADYAAADRYLARALWIDPTNLDALDERDFAFTFTDPNTLAAVTRRLTEDALTHPNDALLLWELAVVRSRAHDRKGALEAARASVALAPNRQVEILINALEHPPAKRKS